jgi:hypothetical protein
MEGERIVAENVWRGLGPELEKNRPLVRATGTP